MNEFFDRECRVYVDRLTIDGLRIAFRIEQTLAKTPNKAEVEIYNLPKLDREGLQNKWVPVVVEAGYKGSAEVIFRGELGHAFHRHPAADWITKLEIGDGDKATQAARANKSFSPGTAFVQVAKYLVDQLGVGIGNALEKLAENKNRGGLTGFGNGLVVSGTAEAEWDKLIRNLGFGWSIQDGQMQILRPGESSERSVPLLGPTSGLVASPVHGEKNNTKITSLLVPSVRPGGQVKVDSEDVKGFFRCMKVTHIGDTHGDVWHTEMEAVPA